MKSFFFKLSIFLGCLFIADRLLGKLFEYIYFHEYSGLHYKLTYAMDKASPDILILGSSRAAHQYIPGVIQTSDAGKATVYNAGIDGCMMVHNLAILKAVLQRHVPQQVLLDLRFYEFDKAENDYDKLAMLLPYYRFHPEIQPLFQYKKGWESIKLQSRLYPYNSAILRMLIGFTDKSRRRDPDYDGYTPLAGTLQQLQSTPYNPPNLQIDSISIQLFKEIIQLSKQQHFQLIVLVSPLYKPLVQTASIDIARQICSEEHVTLLDYSKDKRFIPYPMLFANDEHLNSNGAALYSKVVAHNIPPVAVR